MMLALGFVGMAGALSTDLYLPAFPDIQADLGVPVAAVQLTLTAFLVGSAIGQFVIGILSDAWGRRRTLLGALSLFALAGFAAALAPDIAVLVACRFAQGLFGAAGAALARAVVSDLANGPRAVRGMSALIAMMGLGPALGSPLGALLTGWAGWRATLTGLAVIAVLMVVVAALVIRESLPRERRHPPRIGALLRTAGRLARDGVFLSCAFAFALSYAAFVVYLGASSFVVQTVFGADALTYALTFSASSVSFVAGALGNGLVAARIGADRALAVAQTVAVGAALALAVCALTGVLSLPLWITGVCVFAVGVAASMSNASALTIGRAVGMAGAGSAVLGLTQFLCGALAAVWGGIGGTASATPTVLGMLLTIVLAAVAGALGRRGVRAGRAEAGQGRGR